MKICVASLFAVLTIFGASKAIGQEKRKQLPMVHMSGLLGLVETIPLPTEGWMDHLAMDLKNIICLFPGSTARVSSSWIFPRAK